MNTKRRAARARKQPPGAAELLARLQAALPALKALQTQCDEHGVANCTIYAFHEGRELHAPAGESHSGWSALLCVHGCPQEVRSLDRGPVAVAGAPLGFWASVLRRICDVF